MLPSNWDTWLCWEPDRRSRSISVAISARRRHVEVRNYYKSNQSLCFIPWPGCFSLSIGTFQSVYTRRLSRSLEGPLIEAHLLEAGFRIQFLMMPIVINYLSTFYRWRLSADGMRWSARLECTDRHYGPAVHRWTVDSEFIDSFCLEFVEWFNSILRLPGNSDIAIACNRTFWKTCGSVCLKGVRLKGGFLKVSQRCQPATELEELAKWADNQSTIQTKEAHRLIEPTISQIHTCSANIASHIEPSWSS